MDPKETGRAWTLTLDSGIIEGLPGALHPLLGGAIDDARVLPCSRQHQQ